MKKILIIIGLIIGINVSVFGQEVTLSESELENVLCKQWEIDYAMMNGMKIGQMPGAADFDFKFASDGTYELFRENGNDELGNWIYYQENKYIELSIKEKVTSRIKSIDKNKLILILISGENDPPGLPSVEVHFKPI